MAQEFKVTLAGLEDFTDAEKDAVREAVFEAAKAKVNEILAGRNEDPLEDGGRWGEWSYA